MVTNISKGFDHGKLEGIAIKILKNMGFKDTEIFTDYKVRLGKRNFIIDVFGERKKSKGSNTVAIEVGVCNYDKIIILKTFFDKVIHIPDGQYHEIERLLDLENEVERLQATIKNLERLLDLERTKNPNPVSVIDVFKSVSNKHSVAEDKAIL